MKVEDSTRTETTAPQVAGNRKTGADTDTVSGKPPVGAGSGADAVATQPGPLPTVVRRRRHTVLFVLGALTLFFAGWWLADQFFAYTDNAYVTSDVVAVAPEVTGPIIAVHVHDNQLLKAGDLLISIDPKPFQIAVDQSRAALAQAQAQLPVDKAQMDATQAQEKSAEADLQLADIQYHRNETLAHASVTDQQSLDVATANQREAAAHLDAATAAVAQAEGTFHLHERAVASAEAELELAEWRLDRTEIRAPVDGPAANLTVRAGNMAVEHQPLLAIVDAHAWRVEANYKERFLHHFHPGTEAWVWLDAFPGHWYRAHIEGMSHVISRDEAEPGLVPYVAPTVNWIRVTRRIPVRIELADPPSNMHLFMGSDARTIVFY
jgi:multidrug efflux system membrane fusion protein